MKKTLLALPLIFAATAPLQAVVIASTSFENETPSAQYFDTGDGAVDHDLVNNVGQSPVDSTTATSELGYDASYVATRGGPGLTDGDFVGVTSFTGTVGSYTDGTQGYQMSDTDGLMVLTFDTVDLTGLADVVVSLDYWVAATGWETTGVSDLITITAISNSTTYTILDTAGSDIDDLGIEGSWISGSTAIADSDTEVTLVVALDSNAGSEALFIDNVVIETIPEPTTSLLGALGLVALLRRRR